MRSRIIAFPASVAVLGVVLFLLTAQIFTGNQSVLAATFTIDTSSDLPDANPGDGACASAGGLCSLRAAIQEANASPGQDAITLPAGSYLLTVPGAGEDSAATGDLDITESLSIVGAFAPTTVIDGAGLDRVFHVNGQIAVQLSNLTVRNGSGDGGGGIINTSGTLTITNSTISGNTSFTGGGLYNQAGNLVITNSTISGNSASSGGGGIYSTSGSLTITNSTISGNQAGAGAGIYNNGPLTITNATISNNAGGTTLGTIHNLSRAEITNSIIAGNTGRNCSGEGFFNSGGHNLEDSNTCSFTPARMDILNADPIFGHLADNTGPTFTHALLPGSPAIDAGDDAACPSTDQRGTPRPQGPACDIGAFEAQGLTPTPTPGSPMPTPSPGPGAVVNLQSGWNTVPYNGAFKPVELALSNCLPVAEAVFHWNAIGQAYSWWFKAALPGVNTLLTISPGMALWVNAASACPWSQT